MLASSALANETDVYGPVNLLKTMATPFGSPQRSQVQQNSLSPLAFKPRSLSNLSSRLLPARLYLPGRMVIGQTCEFIIKGKAGQWAALAMADRDTGAKPIYGHEIKLGSDRKLVSVGEIPESGVLSLIIDTPVQGDLIGQQLYFEAALWSRPDFSDLELATPVPSETTGDPTKRGNGVVMAGELSKKRGIRIVPAGMVPYTQQQHGQSTDSGRI